MKKILFLVGEKYSANGVCVEAVMRELQKRGYKVNYITNQEYKENKSEIIDGIQAMRIKPRLIYRLNNWCNNHSGIVSSLVSKLSYVLNKIKLIMSIPSWPLISPLYTLRFYKAAKKLYESENYDCIIPIYTQIDTVIAGYLIKRKYPNVKFVPYFLDSLSGGYGPKYFSGKWIINRGLFWERRLLSRADKFIVMKSSQKHHEQYSRFEEYYSRISILDIPLLTEVNNNVFVPTKLLDNNKINLVYVGSIPHHIRNPKYLLEVFNLLSIENCTLTLIGTNTCPEIIREAQINSKKNRIEIIQRISHTEALNVLKNADFLINIGNNIASMVPSKIFEYMSIGKPIISTYPMDDEPSITYLDKYPNKLLLKENWDHLNEDAIKMETFIRKTIGNNVTINELKERMFKNTPQAFVEEIEIILSK